VLLAKCLAVIDGCHVHSSGALSGMQNFRLIGEEIKNLVSIFEIALSAVETLCVRAKFIVAKSPPTELVW